MTSGLCLSARCGQANPGMLPGVEQPNVPDRAESSCDYGRRRVSMEEELQAAVRASRTGRMFRCQLASVLSASTALVTGF